MTAKDLEMAFQDAVEKVNSHGEPFPADVLLRLYAFYKVATRDLSSPGSKTPLINAFKANALFQVKEMDIDEAKRSYVAYAENYFSSISD